MRNGCKLPAIAEGSVQNDGQHIVISFTPYIAALSTLARMKARTAVAASAAAGRGRAKRRRPRWRRNDIYYSVPLKPRFFNSVPLN